MPSPRELDQYETAAEAILRLFDTFAADIDGNLGDWIEELADDYPEISAALFKMANTGH